MRIRLFILFVFVSLIGFCQVSILSLPTTYTQNFGSIDITTWTNNSTYLGWYATDIGGTLHHNITTANPTNSGGFYTYEISGDNNQKIGSRASGTTGTIDYGVKFVNNTGTTINSISISFNWYQLSVASNEGVANTISVNYIVANAVNLGSTPYININSYALPKDTITGCNSCMYRGVTGNINGSITNVCLDITTTTFTNGRELMVKWIDLNDANNDHHSAIDNLSITFSTLTCIQLPIELLSFVGEPIGNNNILKWITASELNNNYFFIEKSEDAINFEILGIESGSGNSNTLLKYSLIDKNPYKITYYRIKQVDFDGKWTYSNIISVSNDKESYKILRITNMLGQEVYDDFEGIRVIFYSDGTIIKKIGK